MPQEHETRTTYGPPVEHEHIRRNKVLRGEITEHEAAEERIAQARAITMSVPPRKAFNDD